MSTSPPSSPGSPGIALTRREEFIHHFPLTGVGSKIGRVDPTDHPHISVQLNPQQPGFSSSSSAAGSPYTEPTSISHPPTPPAELAKSMLLPPAASSTSTLDGSHEDTITLAGAGDGAAPGVIDADKHVGGAHDGYTADREEDELESSTNVSRTSSFGVPNAAAFAALSMSPVGAAAAQATPLAAAVVTPSQAPQEPVKRPPSKTLSHGSDQTIHANGAEASHLQRRPSQPHASGLQALSSGALSKNASLQKQNDKESGKTKLFGKLFASSNGSSASLGAPPKMNGDAMHSDASESDSTTSSMFRLVRRASEKKPDRKATAETLKPSKDAIPPPGRSPQLPRSESPPPIPKVRDRRGSSVSKGGDESDSGVARTLKEWVGMTPKMSRKGSVTSKRSDDGKSEKSYADTDHGDHHSTSNRKGGPPSVSGQTTASLLKKYGVCEKVAIGKGATAVVRLAHKWDRTQEKLYAVKEFRKRRKNESEKDYVKKLTSEFCISSTLHHINIVETVDLVQDENHHWCEVMEYCPGGDLYAAIKKGNLSNGDVLSYFKQMVRGIAYIHSMGVAHRDIKPENLLLDANGVLKITDFGVSDVFRMCWEKSTHFSRGLCGSEPYIAPEQFDSKEYDARLVDVWAAAVVFYCLNFAELPWRVAKLSDPSYQTFVQNYHSPSPPPLQNLVPRECRAILKRMLDPDPKSRVTTDAILADTWFQNISVKAEAEPSAATAATPFPSSPSPNVAAPSAIPTMTAAMPIAAK